MKILVLADSRGMWPKEHRWVDLLKNMTNSEVHEYISGIHRWLISSYMMEEYAATNFKDFMPFDLLILQVGWHEEGPCFWTKEVWQEIIGSRFNEKALTNEISHDGHAKFKYIDREGERKLFDSFKSMSRRCLFVGFHSLRDSNALDDIFHGGEKHHYDLLEMNKEFDVEGIDFLNMPMDSYWRNQNVSSDGIHYNDVGSDFLASYIARHAQRMDSNILDYLTLIPENEQILNKSLELGSSIASITKEKDVVLLSGELGEDIICKFLGCILYGRIPLIIQQPSFKVFSSEFSKKMEEIKSKVNPTLCVCSADNLELYNNFFNSISSLPVVDISPVSKPNKDDLAFIQLSSGTTGNVKIVEATHKQLIENCTEYGNVIGINKESRIVSWLPLYHDMGLITSVFLPVIFGCKVSMIPTFNWLQNPVSLFEKISQEKGTHVWMPNFAFSYMNSKITDESMANVDLSSLNHLISCSEPTFCDDMLKFENKFSKFGLKNGAISNCYAMAENIFAVTQSNGIKSLEGMAVASCGKAIPGVSIIIRKDGKDVTSTGGIGDIMIKSSSMSRKIGDNDFYGYYCTGDLGFMSNDELYVVGRDKDCFTSFGNNVYPHIVEQSLNNILNVIPGRSCCFNIPSQDIGTNRVGVLVETDDVQYSDDIKRNISGIMKELFDISPFIYVEKRNFLIKTSSGKVSRSATKDKIDTRDRILLCVNDFLKFKRKSCLTNSEDRLHSSGLLDSMDMLELILFLEKTLNIQLNKDKLNSLKIDMSLIDNVNGIIDMLV